MRQGIGGRSLGAWACIFVPVFVLALFVAHFARSFPVWETWFFMGTWQKLSQHENWVPDLFIDRWGHISALPNLLNIGIDSIFNFDQRFDIYFLFLVAIATLLVTARYYFYDNKLRVVLALACLFLTLRAAEIWLDGWNTAMVVPLFMAVTVGALVSHCRHAWQIALAAVVLFLGINAGGYCLPALAASPIILCLRARQGEVAWRTVALWLLACAFVGAYYLMVRASSTVLDLRDHRPGSDFFSLVWTLIARSIYPGIWGSVAFAALMIALLMTKGKFLATASSGPANHAKIYLVIYALVLAGLIASTRAHHGPAPLHERYVPLLCLGPMALLGLCETHYAANSNHVRRKWLCGFAGGLSWAFVLLSIAGNANYWFAFASSAPQLQELDDAYSEFPQLATPGMFLGRASNDPVLVATGLAIMREARIGPYRVHSSPTFVQLELSRKSSKVDPSIALSLDGQTMDAEGNLQVFGWSFDRSEGHAPRVMILRLGDCRELALAGLPRPDVAEALKTPAALRSGWLATFPAACVQEGATEMLVTSFARDFQRYSEVITRAGK
ncbi:hypothetical protein [Dyella amyloliquefaciens]|uniref:hypothetical protein n=1 Tax=Dyella amyloliquefaciens TaxID=1770545 RepID=UPI00102E2566|nr:hypothetical protein [Dyella amyloliquefaciens]